MIELLLMLLPGCVEVFGCGSFIFLDDLQLPFSVSPEQPGLAFHVLAVPPESADAEVNYTVTLRNLGPEPCAFAHYELQGEATPDTAPLMGEDWSGVPPVTVDQLLPAGAYALHLPNWGRAESEPGEAVDLTVAFVLCDGAAVEGVVEIRGSLTAVARRCDVLDSASVTWSLERLW